MKPKLKRTVMYGVWCEGYYWYSEGTGAVTLYTKQEACRRAAALYGFPTYSEAKIKGWVEVVEIAVGLFGI